MRCRGQRVLHRPGGIWVLSPAGEHIGTILQRAVNMNWGDDDWKTLYFTGPTTLQSDPVQYLQAFRCREVSL